MPATMKFQIKVPLIGWADVSSKEEMASMFRKHVTGLGKMYAPDFAEKIWTDTPAEDIETILFNLDKGKLKDKLRDLVRVVPVTQPPPPRQSPQPPRDPLTPRRPNVQAPVLGSQSPPPPYGPLRYQRSLRADPYQAHQDPNWKTQLCCYFERGVCNRYHTCKYAHGQDDLRSRYCPYFLNGEADSCPDRWTGRCKGFHDTKIML
jgi:hypothetical protein